MTLKQWENNGWLRPEPTSKEEIMNLLAIAARDIQDAGGPISPDWRFGIAYNSALKLCTVLLRAEGYRASHGLQHYRTLMAMPLILGPGKREEANYLDTCRKKRNIVEYDYAGGASLQDAKELLDYCIELRDEVLEWLKEYHPEFMA